jgi:O-acetyl-ADP-ribose deacetylase (regulator of RNase III)
VETKVGRTWLEIVSGDIARLDVDAIVAATTVDRPMETAPAGAVKRAGDRAVEDSGGAHGPTAIGDAVPATQSGPKARWVILAAVTGHDLTSNATCIAAATTRSLEVVETLGARSVAFPALGAEAGGFPLYACADIILANVRDYLVEHPRSRIRRVVFCASDAADRAAFGHAMAGLWRSEGRTNKHS